MFMRRAALRSFVFALLFNITNRSGKKKALPLLFFFLYSSLRCFGREGGRAVAGCEQTIGARGSEKGVI